MDLVALTFSPVIADDTGPQKDEWTFLKSDSWFWVAALASLSHLISVCTSTHTTFQLNFPSVGTMRWELFVFRDWGLSLFNWLFQPADHGRTWVYDQFLRNHFHTKSYTA